MTTSLQWEPRAASPVYAGHWLATGQQHLSWLFIQDVDITATPLSSQNSTTAYFLLQQTTQSGLHKLISLLSYSNYYGRPMEYGRPLYFHAVVSIFFASPNLSRRGVDACHTCTHGVALVRI